MQAHPVVVELFTLMDEDKDGLIAPHELRRALAGPRAETYRRLWGAVGLDWRQVFDRLDTDKDGHLDLAEFVAGCAQAQRTGSPARSPDQRQARQDRLFRGWASLTCADGHFGAGARLDLRADGSYRWFRWADKCGEYEVSEQETGSFDVCASGPDGGTLMCFRVALRPESSVLLDQTQDRRTEAGTGLPGLKRIGGQPSGTVEFTDLILVEHNGFGKLQIWRGK